MSENGGVAGARLIVWAAIMGTSLALTACAADSDTVEAWRTDTLGPDAFVIHDVRVFDGEGVMEHRNVVVSDGRVVRVSEAGQPPRNVRVIDGAGRTLLPGLIDSHVHLPIMAEQALAQNAAFGVTTVIDMFSSGETLETLKRLAPLDEPGLADFRTAGVGATAPDGHPSQMMPNAFPTLAHSEDAEAFVEARLADGSDFIKIIYDDLHRYGDALPMLAPETLEALNAAAHERGALTAVHIDTEVQARTALDAGADGLAHLFTGEAVSADFGAFVAHHDAFVIPTLSVLHTTCGLSDGPRLVADDRIGQFLSQRARTMATLDMGGTQSCAALEPALEQLVAENVTILAGTDAPIPGTAFGASLHGELALLVEHGMGPIQALIAATSAPADIFGLSDRGRIESGLRADLVLVDGDPTRDIRATRNIVTVWTGGEPVSRQRYD